MAREITFSVKELYFLDIGITTIKSKDSSYCLMVMSSMAALRIIKDFKAPTNIEMEMYMKELGRMTSNKDSESCI